MLTKVKFLLNLTRDSPPLPTLTLEKVKWVKVGRRRREGWWVMILREFLLLLRSRVVKMARTNPGANRRNIPRRRSEGLLRCSSSFKLNGTILSVNCIAMIAVIAYLNRRTCDKSQISSSEDQKICTIQESQELSS